MIECIGRAKKIRMPFETSFPTKFLARAHSVTDFLIVPASKLILIFNLYPLFDNLLQYFYDFMIIFLFLQITEQKFEWMEDKRMGFGGWVINSKIYYYIFLHFCILISFSFQFLWSNYIFILFLYFHVFGSFFVEVREKNSIFSVGCLVNYN